MLLVRASGRKLLNIWCTAKTPTAFGDTIAMTSSVAIRRNTHSSSLRHHHCADARNKHSLHFHSTSVAALSTSSSVEQLVTVRGDKKAERNSRKRSRSGETAEKRVGSSMKSDSTMISKSGESLSGRSSRSNNPKIRSGDIYSKTRLTDEDIIYLDNHVLAVAKPSGMLSQMDSTGDPCLVDLAKQYLERRYKNDEKRAYIASVHRLDRPVSGVVVFGRTSKAARRLSESFRQRKNVHKVYQAVVEGDLDGEGTFENVLVPQQGDKNRSKIIVVKDGKSIEQVLKEMGMRAKRAILDWAAVHTWRHPIAGLQTLVRVRVYTGRKHQIRAQMANAGHPVVGDVKYGAKARLPQRMIALHARALTVPHPISTMKPLVLNAPVPPEWRKIFNDELVDTMMIDQGVHGLIPPKPPSPPTPITKVQDDDGDDDDYDDDDNDGDDFDDELVWEPFSPPR